ncbi:hypothetical protein Pmar_PMAR008496, partial [Perkinsus marinus ATCC 50983]
ADVKKRWAKLILTLHPDKVPFNWKGDKREAVQKVNEAKKKVIIIIIMVVVVL